MRNQNFFGLMEFTTTNVLPTIAALLTSLFVGWRLGSRIPQSELTGFSAHGRFLLLLSLRYLCPFAITVIVIAALT
jgi:NSS family neurotransmitter:Na+ symporter